MKVQFWGWLMIWAVLLEAIVGVLTLGYWWPEGLSDWFHVKMTVAAIEAMGL